MGRLRYTLILSFDPSSPPSDQNRHEDFPVILLFQTQRKHTIELPVITDNDTGFPLDSTVCCGIPHALFLLKMALTQVHETNPKEKRVQG